MVFRSLALIFAILLSSCTKPASGPIADSTAEASTRQILDAGADWTIRTTEHGGGFLREGETVADGVYLEPHQLDKHPNALDSSPPLSQIGPCLIRALDDPHTALVAHVALAVRYGRSSITIDHEPIKIGGSYVAQVDGLEVTLRPSKKFRPKSYWIMYDCTATIDPSQLPAIREMWRKRLAKK